MISLPISDRPRERMLQKGAEALSSTELLAILLGTGIRGMPVHKLAQELLTNFGSLQQLSEATIEEMCAVRGIGQAKAVQIKAAVTLGLRATCPQSHTKKMIDTPKEAYQLLQKEILYEKREVLFAVLLDIKNQLIHFEKIAVGSLTKACVHPREVFYPAIRHKAASLILAHNHPSGETMPSDEDIQMTSQLIKVGKLIGIPILDHLILTATGFLSLRQHLLTLKKGNNALDRLFGK